MAPIDVPQEYAREITTAQRLVREAAVVIKDHYAEDFTVDYKDRRAEDPVTQADMDANRIIVTGLRAAFPEDAILAEESRDSRERLANRRLWCVDPLDGTREFVDRNGQFVVMIGLAIDGDATVGVVYQPTEDLLWWGAAGTAAQIGPEGEERRLAVSGQKNPQQSSMMVSRSHRSATVSGVAERIGVAQELPLGSVGLKMSRIITGVADVYISVTDKTKEWDACAPEAIIKAAGGIMTDCRGSPLRYNKEYPNTPCGMLATNRHLHRQCVAALAPVAAQRGWPRL